MQRVRCSVLGLLSLGLLCAEGVALRLRCAASPPSAGVLRQHRLAPGQGRPTQVQMQNSMGETGTNDAEMGNTFWAAWGEENGVSDSGEFPAGEDMIEKELKRMFSLDSTEDAFSANEIDEIQVRWPRTARPRVAVRVSAWP